VSASLLARVVRSDHVDDRGRCVMTPTLHIQLLGRFGLTAEDAPLTTLDSPRLQALLAYLLLHRTAPHPRPAGFPPLAGYDREPGARQSAHLAAPPAPGPARCRPLPARRCPGCTMA